MVHFMEVTTHYIMLQVTQLEQQNINLAIIRSTILSIIHNNSYTISYLSNITGISYTSLSRYLKGKSQLNPDNFIQLLITLNLLEYSYKLLNM